MIIKKTYTGAQTRLLVPKEKEIGGIIGDANSTILQFKLPAGYESDKMARYVEFDCYITTDGVEGEYQPAYLLDESNSIKIPAEVTASSEGKTVRYNLKFEKVDDPTYVEKSEQATLFFRNSANGELTESTYTDIISELVNKAVISVDFECDEENDENPWTISLPRLNDGTSTEFVINIPYLDNGKLPGKFFDHTMVVDLYKIDSVAELTDGTCADAVVPDLALIVDQEDDNYGNLYLCIGNGPSDINNWKLIETANPEFENLSVTGDANINGDITVSGTIDVSGELKFEYIQPGQVLVLNEFQNTAGIDYTESADGSTFPIRKANGQLTVQSTPVADTDATSKEYVDTQLYDHTSRVDNPHSVTKAQVGLGSVENHGMDQAPTEDSPNYVTSGGVYTAVSTVQTNLNNHTSDTNNPHSVTKAQVGLSEVVNQGMDNVPTDESIKYVTSGGVKSALDAKLDDTQLVSSWSDPVSDDNIPSEKLTKDSIDAVQTDLTTHINDTDNPHSVTKAQVGLSEVVNQGMDDVPTDNSDKYAKSGGIKSALDAKLDDTQLVSAWSSPTSDSNIPSEKLTKDSIDTVQANLTAHTDRTDNPHSVTQAQVGLSEVVNQGMDSSPTNGSIKYVTSGGVKTALDAKLDDTQLVSSWSSTTTNTNIPSEKLTKDSLDAKLDDAQLVTSWQTPALDTSIPSEKLTKDSIDEVQSDLDTHKSNKLNPHDVTKAQVGLGSVVNQGMDDVPTDNSSKYVTSGGVKSALDAKLDDTQLVTSWQSTPSNTSIPSEKLTKDSLDAKLDDTQLVTSWSATTSNNNIPSEKLTKDSINAVQTSLTGHIEDTSNPHGVTQAQVGLGSVVNQGMDSAPTENSVKYVTSGGVYTAVSTVQSNLDAHTDRVDNPHSVTKAQVGLGSVENQSMDSTPTDGSVKYVTSGGVKSALDAKLDDTQLVTSWAGSPSNNSIPSEKLTKDSLDAKLDDSQLVTSWSSTTSDSNIPSEKLTKDSIDGVQSALNTHTSDTSNPHSVTKAQVGLGNADNTADLDKPISTATQTALDAKLDDSQLITSWGTNDVSATDTTIASAKLTKDTLDTKVDDTQLVTAFQSTPDNTHIPSEKLVSDSLATKAPTNHASTSTTYGVGSTSNYGHVKVDDAMSDTSTNPVQNAVVKAFINSSIGTATADFLGTYDVVTDLGLTTSATTAQVATALNGRTWTQAPTNNDYVFVSFDFGSDPGNIDKYERYKYNGTTWLYEYTLNNSSFTQEQWAAINSGMSSQDKTKLNGIEAGAEVNVQSDWNVSDDTSDAYIKNKPTIPSVYNPTITIQKNSADVGSFTLNQTTASTINITVPVTASDVNALPDTTTYVSTVNGNSGAVTVQPTLVGSGTGQNIKTINNENILGSGNIALQVPLVGSGTGQNIKTINSASILGSGDIQLQTPLTAGTDYQVPLVGSGTGQNIKTINSSSILGSGDIQLQTPLTANVDYQTPLTAGTDYQVPLVGSGAGQNIKTINNASVLGSGNIALQTPLTAGVDYQTPISAGTDYVAHSDSASKVYGTNSSKADTTYNLDTGTITSASTDSQIPTSLTVYEGLNAKLDDSQLITTWGSNNEYATDSNIPSAKLAKDTLNTKQDTLVSGTNIKTINNATVLGTGNIALQTPLTAGTDYVAHQSSSSVVYGTNGSSADTTYGLVSSFQTTPDDTHIATEKLVKDSLDGKVSNYTVASGNYAYTAGASGREMISVDQSATANTLARRGANGVLKVATPVEDGDASTKGYVDDGLAGKLASSSLVSSFQSTPDDTHIPTEKLVYDQLALKYNESLFTGRTLASWSSANSTIYQLAMYNPLTNQNWTAIRMSKEISSDGNVKPTGNTNGVGGTIRLDVDLSGKQDVLVSGTNIKTINNTSLLGSENIELQTPLTAGTDYQTPLTAGTDYQVPLVGSGTGQNIKTINSASILGTGNIPLQTPLTAGTDYQVPLVSGTNIKTINSTSILGTGDISVQTPLTAGTDYVAHSNNALKVYGTNGSSADTVYTLDVQGSSTGNIFDENSTDTEIPTSKAIYKALDSMASGVISVNGESGIVTLDASDVGALPNDTTFATINATSVKGSTAFTLANTDLTNANVGSTNAGKFIKVDTDGTLVYDDPAGGVTSVNSKTGAVVLNASDVSALASNTTFATINSTSVKSGTSFTLAKTDLTNANVGAANSGKYVKVKSDGTLEYQSVDLSSKMNKLSGTVVGGRVLVSTAGDADDIAESSSTLGSATKPIYLSSGVLTEGTAIGTAGYLAKTVQGSSTDSVFSASSTDNNVPTDKAVYTALTEKQDTLISGTNIRTINSTSLIGSGDNISLQTPLTAGVDYQTPLPSLTNNAGKVLAVDSNATGMEWVAIPSAPVSSVNSKTGAVVLSASDVGALPSSTTAASLGAVTDVKVNNQSVVTSNVANITISYPVTSVNSKTGAVSLSASDVSALPSNTTFATINGTSVKSNTAFSLQTPLTAGTDYQTPISPGTDYVAHVSQANKVYGTNGSSVDTTYGLITSWGTNKANALNTNIPSAKLVSDSLDNMFSFADVTVTESG